MSSSSGLFHEDDIEKMLRISGVANECGHYENLALHTAVTNREELKALIEFAYLKGYDAGRASVPAQQLINKEQLDGKTLPSS